MNWSENETVIAEIMFEEAHRFVPSALQLSAFNELWTSVKDGAMVDLKNNNICGKKQGKFFILTKLYRNSFETYCHIIRIMKILEALKLEFGILPMVETPLGLYKAEDIIMMKPTGTGELEV